MPHYLNEDDFVMVVLDYRKDPTAENADTLARSLYALANHCGYHLRLPERDADDFVQDAVLQAWRVMHRFDPRRARAFSFFNQVVTNKLKVARRDRIRHERILATHIANIIRDHPI